MTMLSLRWVRVGALRAARRFRRRDTTEFLLASPANARRIRSALREMEAGGGIRVSSVDEIREMLLAEER